ncbi:MAG: polysaccharide biosynthesis tyrosine autokinase [Rhodobacterales bacterium]
MTSAPSAPPLVVNDTSTPEILDIGALLAQLWRGKWIIAAVVTIFMTGAAYYAFVAATPTFRATATLVLDTRKEEVVNLPSIIGGLARDDTAVNTEVQILRSRRLIGQVVDGLNLLDDPEFNATLNEPTMLASLRKQAVERIKTLLGQPPEPETDPSPEALRDRAITTLLEKTRIENVPLSLVFAITVETESAVKSTFLADTIARLYIADQIALKNEAMEQATTWLADRVVALQAELQEKETRVKEFRAATSLTDAAGLAALDRQLAALRDRLAEQTALQATAQSRLAALSATADEAERARLQRELERATQQRLSLQQAQAELEDRLRRQTAELQTFGDLSRDAESTGLLYEYFLNRLKETSVQQGLQRADARLLSPAVVPERAASPQKTRLVAIAMVLGVIAGIVLVILRDLRAAGFLSATSLEARSGLTVMGQLPRFGRRDRAAQLRYLRDKPTSAPAEAVRNLRTSLLLADIDNPPKVIMTTSALPAEGKTVLSMALAQNLVGLNKRVLLIEGDTRRRIFDSVVTKKPTAGLISVLSGESTLDAAVIHNSQLGADILMAGPSRSNAADIFSSDRFADFIAKVRDAYDYVLIDTPPVLMVPDARIIAQHADAVLFVVKWNSTTSDQLRDGLRMFDGITGQVQGLVLTQIAPGSQGRYGYAASYGGGYYQN